MRKVIGVLFIAVFVVAAIVFRLVFNDEFWKDQL